MHLETKTTTNPKDLFGQLKVSLTKVPAVAWLHAARAMMNGAEKYGPYNWREKEVITSIYVDAALRHILSWWEGEGIDPDSGVHHLGHAIACLAILLDAYEHGCLINDRPGPGRFDDESAFPYLLRTMNERLTEIANGQTK